MEETTTTTTTMMDEDEPHASEDTNNMSDWDFTRFHTDTDSAFRSHKDIVKLWKFAFFVWFMSWLLFFGVVQAVVALTTSDDKTKNLKTAYRWGWALATVLAHLHLCFVGYALYFNDADDAETSPVSTEESIRGNGNLSLQLGAPFLGTQLFGITAMPLLSSSSTKQQPASWVDIVISILTMGLAVVSSTAVNGCRHYLPFVLGVAQVSTLPHVISKVVADWGDPSTSAALEWSYTGCYLWTRVWLWWHVVIMDWGMGVALELRQACLTSDCQLGWTAVLASAALLTVLQWYRAACLVWASISSLLFSTTTATDNTDNTTTNTSTTATTTSAARTKTRRSKKDN